MTKNNYFPLAAFTAALFLVLFTSCEKEIPTDLTQYALIPQPVSTTATHRAFQLKKGVHIYYKNAGAQKTAEYLAGLLRTPLGRDIAVKDGSKSIPKGHIILELTEKNNSTPDEGYLLTIGPKEVRLTASAPSGLFWGVQTLRQLLPPQIEAAEKQPGPWILPTGTIEDYPAYYHRGAMLDVCRHFFGVADVKRYIDFLAAFKMNTLHLHLSDDQGWRIEIKKWPNLTARGGSTQVGGGKGGFFTQEQYKKLVRYAQERSITIIPEIDMPGHTNAALASYPELNCNGKAPELYTGTDVGFSSLCIHKKITYQFIDDVIAELAAITPGPYIHIGGDESHATKKEDYIPFINRVKKIVESHGKKMIGWDETAQADLDSNSVVQLWASPKFAQLAAKKGAKLIMSPANKAYLDMQYDSTTRLGLHWAGYIEVDSAYIWDPATLLPGIPRQSILGLEAPLWTETIATMDDLEYMVFPRLPGYAEIGWSPASHRHWEAYKKRLARMGERMEIMGIDFYRSKYVPWQEEEKEKKGESGK